jgi:transposase
MPYRHISDDLKSRALYLQEHSELDFDPVAALGVSEASIRRWGDNLDKYGSVHQPWKHKSGRPTTLSANQREELYQLLKTSPELYLDEIHEWMRQSLDAPVSRSTVYRTIRDLGFTHRKLKLRATQRSEEDIEAWMEDFKAQGYTADQLISIDESSKDGRNLYRNYGWGLRGESTMVTVEFPRGERWSLLPAMTVDGYIAKRVVLGSVDGGTFIDFILEDVVSQRTKSLSLRCICAILT